MKVAIVYDRVNKWGGAERVLLALHKLFPKAPLYTSVYDEKQASWAKAFPKIYTSFLQKIPFAQKNHEFLATLMPIAFEQFDFGKYDLVISVTSEAAKGIITRPGTTHICYCLTPTRYLWSGYEGYFKNPLLKFFSLPIVSYLRSWDKIAVQRPDKIITISSEVHNRVKKYYSLDSEVVFPPVDLNSDLSITKQKSGTYYLYVGRLVGYKKVDLLVKTFNKLNKKLVIVGNGWQKLKLKLSANNNIEFPENVSDKELKRIYKGAKAFIMPQIEDFGIVSVEAQSFGIPVIAYKEGGAQDSVVEGITGVFFDEQTSASLEGAIEKFEKMSFNRETLITNAQKFSTKRFEREFLKLIK